MNAHLYGYASTYWIGSPEPVHVYVFAIPVENRHIGKMIFCGCGLNRDLEVTIGRDIAFVLSLLDAPMDRLQV